MTDCVRWAPSNTGADVHLGNVRTILYNYLYAKSKGGKSIFRIEDSDVARSRHEYAIAIVDTLNWLGLTADEGFMIGGSAGPYLQTDKLPRYMEVAKKLVNEGKAYYCYCTSEELDERRSALPEKERAFFRYPGTCRDKVEEANNPNYVIRFKAPTEGFVQWKDLVFGKMSVPNKENYDWVIMRSNGIPLYNFGCVIDDIDQGITHIIRGRDHIVNSPIQILLHQAINGKVPEMAHLGMILGQDGEKLSKRHASVSISEYRHMGYTPSGILNYLARLGWANGNQELFSMQELISAFSIEACGKKDAKFDPVKFASIQHEHLKSSILTPNAEYVARLLPFLEHIGVLADEKKILAALPLVRPRAKTLVEAADEMIPFLVEKVDTTPRQINESTTLTIREKIHTLLHEFGANRDWTEVSLRQLTKDWLAENNHSLKDVGGFLRLSLTGRYHSPELFQVMEVLGKEQSLRRLEKAVSHLNNSH